MSNARRLKQLQINRESLYLDHAIYFQRKDSSMTPQIA